MSKFYWPNFWVHAGVLTLLLLVLFTSFHFFPFFTKNFIYLVGCFFIGSKLGDIISFHFPLFKDKDDSN